jgi:hypothetical protein
MFWHFFGSGWSLTRISGIHLRPGSTMMDPLLRHVIVSKAAIHPGIFFVHCKTVDKTE